MSNPQKIIKEKERIFGKVSSYSEEQQQERVDD